MRDVGADETDKIIIEIENRIRQEYTQAEREIREKLADYLRRFEIKDRTWQKWVAEGKKTEAEYKAWRTGQIAIGERWEEMRQTIAEDLLNASKIARSIANGYMPEVYALNHDYGTYQVETGSLIDTSYTLYNREAAERIFRENPKMLPAPGKKVSQAIKDKKAIRWNNSHIQSVMMQALLQGNSIPDIATRLANAVGDSDRKAAIRNARTMATGAQNAGRVDAYSRAGKMGLKVRKQWLATLDLRTRHEHRMLDGQIVDNDKPFDVDGDKIMFPGDPSAKGYLVYNCFTGDTLVSTDSDIIRTYKHKFEGELIEVKCASGINFTCTPNHPILCPTGWVPAELLNDGNDILVTLCRDRTVPGRNPNINQTFTRIKTVHNLHKFFFGSRERCGVLRVNFHGDIPTSDVEIIRKKRLLWINRNSCIGKGFAKFLLKLSHFFLSCKSHFVKSFRGIDVSTLSHVSGGRKFLPFFWSSVGHSNIHGFGSVPNTNVILTKYSINDLPAETIIRSELLNGLTGDIFVDKVISVNRRVFKGHVYNLQTRNGYYYVTNNIAHIEQKDNDNYCVIAKNCRCRLMAAIEGHERDLSNPNLRSRSALAGMTYEEWKAEKESKNNSILLPEEKGENIRAKYIREYRGYGGPVASGRDTTLNIDRDDLSAPFAPSKGNAASPSYKDAKGALPLQDTMSKTAYDQYARQLRNAGDDIINLHDKYDYSTGFINVDIQKDSGDACYSRSSGTVKYTLKDNRSGDRFQWLNHECGHMYDDKIDGSIKDMTFEEFSKIREAAGWNGYSQPNTPSRSDEFMSAMRKDIEKLWDVVSAPNWETLNSELLLDDASSGVQDFLDGVFGKSQAVKTIWGHGESYYNRMYESLGKSGYIQEIAKTLDYDEETLKDVLREYETSSELWANICSALTGGGNAEKYMRMYAPESLKAFLSIIRRI